MMKSIKYGLLLILPGIVLTTQAAERQEVKCHLITSKGEQIASIVGIWKSSRY